MNLYTQLPDDLEEVDVIIAGGGSSGCIVASRLADSGLDLSILVIEGGTDNYAEPTIVHPAFLFSRLVPNNKFMLYYQGTKSEHLADREPVVLSGGTLGGGSSGNLMLYSRPQKSDIDAWNTPGWEAGEVLQYMNKFETYHGPGNKDHHGYDGPMHVSSGGYRGSMFENNFVTAVNKVGWPEVEDFNDMSTTNTNGVTRAMRYVSPEGKRQDTAHQYLHPRLRDGKHPKLHVLVESQVEHVLFEGTKAVGVAYRHNPMFESSSKGAYNIRTVKARKMVILSCGALGTPLLLERSGIGSREVLNRANVPVVADLPGVGSDYQDHHMMLYSYKSRLGPKETLDGINSRGLNSTEFMTNDKILGWNSVDAQCKLQPDEADVANLGPKFQNAWDKEFKSFTNKPMTILSAVACYPGDPSAVPAGQYFAIAAFSLYPFSRGHIHITGPKLEDKPDFDLGFFADEEGADIKKHIWTYKKQREIVRRMEVYGGEIGGWHPPFPTTSKAACIDTECPLGDVPDIEYTVENDQIIEKWVREHVDTTWHSLGTCKMAPRVELGVVDPSLNVYGVERLKVADLSIPPSNIGANTNSTAMAIGEKAADIFARELGLA